MFTITPAVAVFNDLSAPSPFSMVAPSLLIGGAVALLVVVAVLTRIVKGLVGAVSTVMGPLFKALGYLVVIIVLLMTVMFAGGTNEVAPTTQSFTSDPLVFAEK
ncbi:MAG: hypothetical protein QOI21_1366 [Actinomycetota bacterium]|nr:hypothetical protein [Actinomycetota bacterium]